MQLDLVFKTKRKHVFVGNGIPKLKPDIPIIKSVQVAILSVLCFFVLFIVSLLLVLSCLRLPLWLVS